MTEANFEKAKVLDREIRRLTNMKNGMERATRILLHIESLEDDRCTREVNYGFAELFTKEELLVRIQERLEQKQKEFESL